MIFQRFLPPWHFKVFKTGLYHFNAVNTKGADELSAPLLCLSVYLSFVFLSTVLMNATSFLAVLTVIFRFRRIFFPILTEKPRPCMTTFCGDHSVPSWYGTDRENCGTEKERVPDRESARCPSIWAQVSARKLRCICCFYLAWISVVMSWPIVALASWRMAACWLGSSMYL